MNTRRLIHAVTALLAGAGGLAGCDVQTYDDAASAFNDNSAPPGQPPPNQQPPPSGFNPTWSDIQANVFTPTCATANCHSGGNPGGALNLESANSHAQLVNVASTGSALDRVEPGFPDDSYLIHKLEGTGGVAIMPPAGALDQADIDTIRQWVQDGAADDTAQAPPLPIAVSSLSPAHQSTLDMAPNQVVVGFTREVDQSTVNANTFEVIGAGGDGVFGNANDNALTANAINVNATSATFDLTNVVMNDDIYRIYLRGTGASVISDLDANALDGEFDGNFPSGDETAGGDFVSQFELVTPVALEPNLPSIQSLVFTPTCATANCHSGAVPDGGLDLTDGNSYANLVNVVCQGSALDRVEPGLPDDSYLIQKLETVGAGVMPPAPASSLPQADIDIIRLWITNGAAEN